MNRTAWFLSRIILPLLVLLLWQGCSQQPQKLRIAAASDLKYALDEIATSFRLAHPGADIEISYGSSGNFYAQIVNHAPYDLFLSADLAYPAKLDSQGLALAGSAFTYGVGRIVIWVPNGSPIDPERDGAPALLDSSAGKIAIANPEHAPYGRAAVAALKSLGLYDAIRPRLVYGENIMQTAQFVQTGSAGAGIIALSLALAPNLRGKGHYVEIPPDRYPAMKQGGVIMGWAASPDLAREFREYMLGSGGGGILRRNGFSLPGR